ncbi:hypothetical protein [Stakelama pacifica]|uniref:Uncharacterized protein n=1 Tax=Stakelama pacifica TaxID=517720 RepID=A0A4R6FUD2_9SPHN|nr:hypothetical protein [Stakelama pacifica]TDN85372.1 hypothetical protein EV664_10278 [Stakelama pacifica]GGO92843.1 hypothetical protein GCM10011329_10890 [Stakelama pacifica]
MFERLEARGQVLAREAARAEAKRIAGSVDVPGIGVEVTDDGVVLTGRGLWRRWINDARWRWIAGWAA